MENKYPTKITDLKPDTKNFNKHTQFGMSLLEKSMRKNGFIEAGVISEDGVIISGNARQQVAADIGLTDLQIIDVDGTKAVYLRAKGIKSGTKEFHELAFQLNQVAVKNIDLDEVLAEEILGEEVLKEYGMESSKQAQEDAYDIPDTIKTDIVKGDLFEIGRHRLLCGDSTKSDDVFKLMGEERIDLIFIDPPYAVKYGADQQELQKKSGGKFSKTRKFSKIEGDELDANQCAEKIWSPAFKNLYDFAKDDCSFYMTMCQGGDQMMMMMMMMMNQHWQIKHEIIWVKNAPVFSMGRLDYDYKHEPILFGWKKKHNFYGSGEFTKSVWEIPKPSKSKDHPTMKPVALVGNAILNSSKDNDLVCDYFLGSGTTMVASHELKRKCFGIEFAPEYCQVIIDRMLKLDPSLDIKRNGKSFKK